ncbi:MAG TPA: ATP-binding protein [Gemmataceae bacterium]|jgi:two-component system phosphate regulon sensor histidine kinase PhoR
MFRRLFASFTLLMLAIFAAMALVIAAAVQDADMRRRGLTLIGGAAGVAVLGGSILSARLIRRWRRPLQALIGVADKLSEGAGGQHVFTYSRDEIGELVGAFNRMSERLDARIAQLEEDRQQLRTILSGMVEGVVALDANQRILYANERATQLLGLPWQAPVGRRLWEVVRRRSLLDVVQRALDSSEPQREEVGWSGPGTRSLTVHAARLDGLPPRGAVLVLHDTTELRRLERLRQEFVANVSHELKTPLSVIKVCVETLLDGAMDDPQHRGQFLEQIAGQSNRLHALILDLLSLARLESGEELFDFQPVVLEEVVQACLERHRPRAETKRQTIEVVPPEGAELITAWADEEAVEQILDNLLDNAVKYTPEGGRLSVRWRAEGEQVLLEVSDTGIGIPEADLPRIFERFYRVDKARSREMGGTGLGLSIVKHLTQALRGSVRADSRPGRGTTFIVSLPRAPLGA